MEDLDADVAPGPVTVRIPRRFATELSAVAEAGGHDVLHHLLSTRCRMPGIVLAAAVLALVLGVAVRRRLR